MGASKTAQFKAKNIKLALINRAMAHPARIEIIEILRKNEMTNCTSLCHRLELTKSTVHDHLLKMREAGIIRLTYESQGYIITLVPKRMSVLRRFLK